MPFQYYLMPNVITSDPDDHMAAPTNTRTATIEDVFNQMTHEGSTVTMAEGMAAWEELNKGVVRLVGEGYSIVTSLFNISPSIVGVFTSEDDRFDPARHQVKIRVQLGIRLQEAEKTIKTEKVQPKERLPVLLHYEDNTTESKDSVATPNGGGRITGNLLKFDEGEAAQGIFFVNTKDGSETKAPGKMLRNKPGELIFMNPKLPAGMYRLEVRTVLRDKKGLFKGTLPDTITAS